MGLGQDVFPKEWSPVGPGGGGCGISPAISPHDKRIFFCATDMQPLYRSDDSGATWRTFDGTKIRGTQSPVVFHPTDPLVMFVGILGGVMKSVDGGYTWNKVFGRAGRLVVDIGRSIVIDPRNPKIVYAAVDHMDQVSHSFTARSTDCGDSWEVVHRTPGLLAVNHLFIDPGTGRLYATAICRDFSFTAHDTGLPPKFLASDDEGRSWDELALPEGRLLDGAAAIKDGRARLFALMRSEIRLEKVIGGFYRSDDAGRTWKELNSGFDMRPGWDVRGGRPAPAMEFRKFAVAPSDPDVIYVPLVRHGAEPEAMSMVYKSTDGGDTWKRVLNSDAAWGPVNVEPDWLTESVGWWWGGLPNSLAIAPSDADVMIFCDDGRLMGTFDGGTSWKPLYTKYHSGGRGESIGWEDTNCYTYEIDPFDSSTHFITYTDTGLFKSTDAGKTWKWSVGKTPEEAPWRGNFYQIVFDPEVKGLIWGAATPVHDLPHWKMLQGDASRWTGAVVVSRDRGETWEECAGEGLAAAPCTHLIVDGKSPREARRLYASMFGKGVYRTDDGGRTWSARNAGLGFRDNLNVWQVHMAADGALLAAVSAARKGDRVIPGGIFRSRDAGESWEFVNESRPLPYPFGLAAHPTDADTFYVAGCDLPVWYGEGLRNRTDDHLPMQELPRCEDSALGGGLYKTTDGGRTFRRTLDVWNCYSPAIDPRNSDIVYAACFDAGVFRSTDAGETWKRVESLPIVNVNHISFDRTDARRVYALTCGAGVWTARIK